MKNSLLFDFTIDKSTNTILIKREFDAELSLVWYAFTTKEILDQWWAPKPWRSVTKLMRFEVGGRRFYAMVSPQGEAHWSIQEYISINPKYNFKLRDAFSDAQENIYNEMPSSEWDLNFSEVNGATLVNISIQHTTKEALEKHIEMGFQGGFTMTLNYLEQLINSLK